MGLGIGVGVGIAFMRLIKGGGGVVVPGEGATFVVTNGAGSDQPDWFGFSSVPVAPLGLNTPFGSPAIGELLPGMPLVTAIDARNFGQGFLAVEGNQEAVLTGNPAGGHAFHFNGDTYFYNDVSVTYNSDANLTLIIFFPKKQFALGSTITAFADLEQPAPVEEELTFPNSFDLTTGSSGSNIGYYIDALGSVGPNAYKRFASFLEFGGQAQISFSNEDLTLMVTDNVQITVNGVTKRIADAVGGFNTDTNATTFTWDSTFGLAAGQTYTVEFKYFEGWQYLRLRFQGGYGAKISTKEIVFFDDYPAVVENASSFASSEFAGSPVANAFDGNYSSIWASNNELTGTVGIKTTEPIFHVSRVLYQVGNSGEMPTGAFIEGATDNNDVWSVLFERDEIPNINNSFVELWNPEDEPPAPIG